MKNIIYGLGNDFWKNLEHFSEIIPQTVAFCDADESKKEYENLLNKPVITPEYLLDTIKKPGESITVYIATTYFFDEIYEKLTKQFSISPENIKPLPLPDISKELISIKRKFFLGNAEFIKAEALESATLLPDRTAALEYMPKNAVVAEIGVAYGDFSKQILTIMNPSKFYAIDYFHQNDPFCEYFGRNDFKRDNMTHRQWYEHRFRDEIKCGVIETRQGMSWDCISEFPDEYFDYIYLDAAHDYNSVKRDIGAMEGKIKNGGFIQFNDYGCGPALMNYAYGVIAAVNSFVNSGKHKIKFFCLSPSGHHDVAVQVFKDKEKQ